MTQTVAAPVDLAPQAEPALQHAQDVCSLSMARRLAAMVDRDPATLREGDALPRGWHVMLFNPPTRQSELRPDGAASLGVTMPDLGLPRLMLGGRTVRFEGDIPLGAAVRRETRQGEVRLKEGRSGRFALVEIEHRIFVEGGVAPVIVERSDYLLREASVAEAPALRPQPAPEPGPEPVAQRTLVPDPPLLFRYSAITDNPHRIHYDLPYAQAQEGYTGLLVNGSIPTIFLLEMFRDVAGREPEQLSVRNLAPMFSGARLTLTVAPAADGWLLRAADASGALTFEGRAR